MADISIPELPLQVIMPPGALIVVKVAVLDKPPFGTTFMADKVLDGFRIIEENFKIARRDVYMQQSHAIVQNSIVKSVVDLEMTENLAASVGCAALWCVVNHPNVRERSEMRKALGSYLKAAMRAHVAFTAFADGKISMGVDQAPVAAEKLEEAKDNARRMNEDGDAKAAKTVN